MTKEELKDWLINTEKKYGGYVKKVPRTVFSPHDLRPLKIQRYEMGGDRMDSQHHGYADIYAEYLLSVMDAQTIVEVGVLRGSGLAMWCDLFPKSRVIGLDIDLNNIRGNMPALEQAGAFKENRPELYGYDQLRDNEGFVKSMLGGGRVDVCIDDASHLEEGIIKTMKDILPHLADKFVYFIEDNHKVLPKIRELYPDYRMGAYGRLIVITN